MIQLDIFQKFSLLQQTPTTASDRTIEAYDSGRQRRDAGMNRAIEHAGEKWAQSAYNHFRDFLDGIPSDRRFMTEQVRRFARERGLDAPPSERAWGAVTTRLAKEGKIIRVGFAQVTNEKAHATPATLWRKI